MVGQVLGVVQKGGFSGFARGLCRVHLRRSNLQDVCFINTRFTRLGWPWTVKSSFWFFWGANCQKAGFEAMDKFRQLFDLMIDALMPRQE